MRLKLILLCLCLSLISPAFEVPAEVPEVESSAPLDNGAFIGNQTSQADQPANPHRTLKDRRVPANRVYANGFLHRGYLGWVRDLASEPQPGQQWPAIGIDDQLVRDYDDAARQLARDGINEFEIWGLLASHSYPAELPLHFSETREKQARRVIAAVHKHGIRVLAGTGIYSWGFDAIVGRHPEISCSNSGQLADPTQDLSWRYQRSIIDALFALGADGIELQPGDQGRCQCGPRCAALGDDASYYASIITQSARYVRRRYPGKLLFIGGYGIDLHNPDHPEVLSQTLRSLDVYTDVGNSTVAFRKRLAAEMKPAMLAGIAAPGVSPPQHLARDHWFLPTFQHQVEQLKSLYADGGRASENFMRILANPSDEISMRVIARFETATTQDWRVILDDLLREIYRPSNDAALQQLASIFIDAESAYFDDATVNQNFDIELEPLIGSEAKPLTYLTRNMNSEQRMNYRVRLGKILARAESIRDEVGNRPRFEQLLLCLRNVLGDIDGVSASESHSPGLQ